MQKVVIDTNVIVSAFISSNGIPAKIIDLIVGNEYFIVCYNAGILFEYENVLSRKKFEKYNFSPAEIANFIQNLKEIGLLVERTTSNIVLPDENDRIFFDTAKAAEAALLITGNLKHYPTEDFVITPSIFLQLYQTMI